MRDVDVAYIAGLFDGEGDVGLYPYTASKNGKRYQKLTARIHNTNRDVLDWVVQKLSVGKVFHDRKGVKLSGNPARKQCYVFVTAHAQARVFLKIVFPFLIIKRERVKECLMKDQVYSEHMAKRKPG